MYISRPFVFVSGCIIGPLSCRSQCGGHAKKSWLQFSHPVCCVFSLKTSRTPWWNFRLARILRALLLSWSYPEALRADRKAFHTFEQSPSPPIQSRSTHNNMDLRIRQATEGPVTEVPEGHGACELVGKAMAPLVGNGVCSYLP